MSVSPLTYTVYPPHTHTHVYPGIVPVTPVRPIRRNSTVTQLAVRATPTTTSQESLPPITDLPEDTSDYFSISGDEPTFCRSRSQSITVSTSGDFYSCLDEREFQERAEHSSPFITFPTSLEEELEQIELDSLAEKMAGVGVGSSYLQTSWQR